MAVGPPAESTDDRQIPSSRFLGNPPMNLLSGRLVDLGGRPGIEIADMRRSVGLGASLSARRPIVT
jgi:hypothetical protein